MQKKLNYELIHFHLREALGEIESLYNIVAHLANLPIKADGACSMLEVSDEAGLKVRFAYADHRLNTAWNARRGERGD